MESSPPTRAAIRSSWSVSAEKALMGYACRDDFWMMLKYGMGVIRNPRGAWLDEEVHKPLCYWLQSHGHHWLRHRHKLQDKRLMVIWPRDTGKTVVVTKAFQLWLHLQDPDLATAMGSASAERAYGFLGALKLLMEGKDPYAGFTKYFGSWCDPSRPWREDKVVHAKRIGVAITEPSFGTFSVETGATSYHPDAMFYDDPITQELIDTDSTWLDKVNDSLVNFIPVLKRGGLFVYVGTPYHDADAIHTLLREEGYRRIYGMPMRMEGMKPNGKWDVFYMQGRREDRTPVFPRSWPEDKLADLERRSPATYWAQVMCQPTEGEHQAITRKQIEECYIASKDVPKNCSAVIHLDTAFKVDSRMGKGDDNVIVVSRHPRNGSGDVYFTECYGSNQWTGDQFLDELSKVVRKLKNEGVHLRAITDEMTQGGKAGAWEGLIKNYLRNLHLPVPPVISLGRGGTRKLVRIREAAAYWVDGHVFIVRGAPGIERLVGQMLAIGQSAHDDYADAAADAFHEKVYYPMVDSGEDTTWTAPSRPYDEMLQGPTGFDDDYAPRMREPIT